jgi:hypothetical protein
MKQFIKIFGVVFVVLFLGIIFYTRAAGEYEARKGQYANFVVFWLSGNLVLNGQSPYDANDWLDGHRAIGFETPLEPIFLYPLPLAVLMAPLGAIPFEQAWLGWKILTQILVGVSIYLLLTRWQTPPIQRLFVPLTLSMLYFGPVLLSMRTGSIGAVTLLLLCIVILFLQKGKSFEAGLLLSLTMLKPPQGLLILILLGIWFLAKRDWKAIGGVALGGVALLLIGLVIDVNWVGKFLNSGEAAFDRRLGFHSNLWSFSYLLCGRDMTCTYLLGGLSAASLLGVSGFYLWKKQAQVGGWEALNFILPVGFISTVYLWEYDQILYIIPIVWIVGTLVQKTKSYIHAFLILIVLVFYAFFALGQLALLDSDLWSLGNTLMVFIGLWLAYWVKERPAKNT